MELLFDRVTSTNNSLISNAYEDGVKFGVGLERPWMNGSNLSEAVAGKGNSSAILPGRYQVISVNSAKHGSNWPCLKDVPGRTAIELHIGNSPGDVIGCTAIGAFATADYIHESTDTFNSLLARIREAWSNGDEVWATYQNSF